MKPLEEWTLKELVNAYFVAGPPTHEKFWAELSRRQAMLDAAEGMAKAINIGCLEDAATALAAYESAKGKP